jgi:hypothetical protein
MSGELMSRHDRLCALRNPRTILREAKRECDGPNGQGCSSETRQEHGPGTILLKWVVKHGHSLTFIAAK